MFPISSWFPVAWKPTYYVNNQAAVQDYDAGRLIDPDYIMQPDYLEGRILPPLPSFFDLNIDITPLMQYDSVRPDQLPPMVKKRIDVISQMINTELVNIKRMYPIEVSQGFYPVPDFDEERFSWIQKMY
jgi:hypothetical protein